MTQEQKLEIVYKKLFSQRVFTKEGTQFFEEPFSTFSQVIPSYVYVNSDYVPESAPNTSISVGGIDTLKYVEREKTLPIDSSGKKFRCQNGKIIPISYGYGYGIELRTGSGSIIQESEFPYLIDWESGEVIFDETPFDVSFNDPPIATYHFYSGKTLQTINSFSITGPRGNVGQTGETGPVDESTLIYRGNTDFTESPAIQYKPNDVITFTDNGNSYICLLETTDSPIVSPSSWQNISPAGTAGQLPNNVLYVNHPNAISISSSLNGSEYYFIDIQDAINAAPECVATTIVVNQLDNQFPISSGNLTIENKTLNIIFRKLANVSSKNAQLNGFKFSIIDSDVIIQNAQIGGQYFINQFTGDNDVIIESKTSNSTVKFLDCRFNSKTFRTKRNSSFNATVIFERCSLNCQKFITNSDVIIRDTSFSGSMTLDYSGDSVKGKKHIVQILNSFGFQKFTYGSVRDVESYDIVVLIDRYDTANLSVKLENSVFSGFGIVVTPDSQNSVSIDCNNSIFYLMGMNIGSALKGATINVVGSNNSFSASQFFDNFDSRYFLIDNYNVGIDETFHFVLNPQNNPIQVVTWDQGSLQFLNAYDSYKMMMLSELERCMLSL